MLHIFSLWLRPLHPTRFFTDAPTLTDTPQLWQTHPQLSMTRPQLSLTRPQLSLTRSQLSLTRPPTTRPQLWQTHPQLGNSGLKENFPTPNNDFVVAFMCFQLVNTMYPTWLERTISWQQWSGRFRLGCGSLGSLKAAASGPIDGQWVHRRQTEWVSGRWESNRNWPECI